MQLYPAIDMLDGNAVRLRQGRRDDVTIFGNPVDLAAKWREQGATYLHLVDLTAAFDGQTKHLPLIREVIRAFGGNVELGGGLRTLRRVRQHDGVALALAEVADEQHRDHADDGQRRKCKQHHKAHVFPVLLRRPSHNIRHARMDLMSPDLC